MGSDKQSSRDANHHNHSTMKRKTSLQLQALENLYTEDRYPSQKTMEHFALSINLTYKQVRCWFVEQRRREKRETSSTRKEISLSSRFSTLQCVPSEKQAPLSSKCTPLQLLSSKNQNALSSKSNRLRNLPSKKQTSLSSKSKRLQSRPSKTHSKFGHQYHVRGNDSKDAEGKSNKLKQRVTFRQNIRCLDSILKDFRKDGPALGVDFDPLPSGAFHSNTTGPTGDPSCARTEKVAKKRKVTHSPVSHFEVHVKESGSVMKHGMGKGLMTVWRATNPGARGDPTGVSSIGTDIGDDHFSPTSAKSTKPLRQGMKKPLHKLAKKPGIAGNKLLERRKRAIRNTKVSSVNAANPNQSHQAECKLALEGLRSQAYPVAIANLLDDEELELRELQAGSNPPSCSAHLAFNGMHSCSLCKDLLAKFPPRCVRMKHPLCMQPWSSSLELVKKLFEVLRFLYSHSNIIDICPFTLDEFAQAFHDKDSLLLGKIHMALLKLLFSDVGMELTGGSLSHANKNYRFVGFLHSVRQQEFILKLWNKYLNPMTWTEIVRQVLVAAGFNSSGKLRSETLNKDDNPLAEYGLRPGTLKGELFSILSEHGNNGLKISELAKACRVLELKLTDKIEELELLICSTLSSDITLFEKISPSAYRVRGNSLTGEGLGEHQSDSEDSGSIDSACGDSITNSSDESELDSVKNSLSIVRNKLRSTQKSNFLTEYTEIDESDPGELWMLALMDGEYSELGLEEKLNTLVALIDLTSGGSSIRMETTVSATSENLSAIQHHGGAKIKRSSAKQNLLNPFLGNITNVNAEKEIHIPDGSKTNCAVTEKMELNGHPLQSILLGSDRRFNKYWLFLGPCNANDPGHRRIYFESSDDGHWEVIDTKEALCSLLTVLDGRGSREAFLLATLMRLEAFLCKTMSTNLGNEDGTRQASQCDQSSIDVVSGDGSSPLSDVDNNLSLETVNDSSPTSGAIVIDLKNNEELKRKWERLQALDSWIWNTFYSNLNAVKHSKRSYLDSLVRCANCHDLYWRVEKHCKICHTTFELDFDLEEKYAIHVATCREVENSKLFPNYKVLSTQLQSLKAALHAIEGAMPKEALVTAWTTSDHKLWVTRLRRTSSLSELLQVLTDFVGAINEDWLCQCTGEFDQNTVVNEMIESFPTIPQTTSAIALWLVKLDALIVPGLEGGDYVQVPERSIKQKRKR